MSDLQVVCSDRGAHTPHVLARMKVSLRRGELVVFPVTAQATTRRRGGRVVDNEYNSGSVHTRRDGDLFTFTFTCPTCGRNLRIRGERLVRLAESDGRRAAWRVSTLDISRATS